MNDNAEMKLSIMLSLFRLRAPSITLLTTWLFSCWGRLIPMRFLAASRGESAVLHPASKAASQRRLSSTRPLHRHRAGFEHPTGGGAMNHSLATLARVHGNAIARCHGFGERVGHALYRSAAARLVRGYTPLLWIISGMSTFSVALKIRCSTLAAHMIFSAELRNIRPAKISRRPRDCRWNYGISKAIVTKKTPCGEKSISRQRREK